MKGSINQMCQSEVRIYDMYNMTDIIAKLKKVEHS